LHLERKLNNPVNKFEEESTRKLKNSFDSLNLLNPDILVGAVIDA
jgi:hypothetical protein